jgi:hypothetical protein
MTHANTSNVVQFSYRALPDTIFTQMTGTHCGASLRAEMLPLDGLAEATVFHDGHCEDQTGTLLIFARAEAAYRPKVQPTRPTRKAGESGTQKRLRSAAAEGRPVCPTHPAHLVIVSARRARPARLCASQPVAVAIATAREALYPEKPATSAPQNGLRMVAHSVTIFGLCMTAAQTAVAQQMLSLF